MKRKELILITFALIIVGCLGQSSSSIFSDTNCIEIDIDGVKTSENICFSNFFENFKLIPLETTEECQIGRIDNIRIIRDKIVVLDKSIAKSVFVFDLTGKFLTRIGRIGKGPGEYISLTTISTDETRNEIAVYDGMLNRILLFSSSGTFLKDVQLNSKISAKSIELFKDYIYVSNYIHETSKYLLYAIDRNGKIKDKWIPNSFNKNIEDNIKISANTIFTHTDKYLRHRTWLMNSVYSINEDSVVPFIKLKSTNAVDLNNLLDHVDNNGSHITPLQQLFIDKKFTGVHSYCEVNNMSMIEYTDNGKRLIIFFDHISKKFKVSIASKFQDDMTFLPGNKLGYFQTTYKDNLVAHIDMPLLYKVLENHESFPGTLITGKTNKYNFKIEDNPCVVMYKCKKNGFK